MIIPMNIPEEFVGLLSEWAPVAIAFVLSIVISSIVRFGNNQFRARKVDVPVWSYYLTQAAVFVMAIVAIILAMPIDPGIRGQLLSLVGLMLGAIISLSSTTFVGNALAGVMLRTVRNVQVGDFVEVQQHFGRVSELHMLHSEVQGVDRSLTTIPNMYLVTNPVTVVRSSGAIVQAEVSLGYDVSRTKIQNLLVESAKKAGLEDPFVHILELGDFSVLYRVSGLLKDVKTLVSARSHLRECMLDTLHEAEIEIVSPNFMNQRQLDPSAAVIPQAEDAELQLSSKKQADSLIFDKAERAENVQRIQELIKETETKIQELKESKDEDRADKKSRIETLERQIKWLSKQAEFAKKNVED